MATAKVFKSGNSQAVRLPKAFRVKSKEVEISRRGGEIVLRERTGTMARAFDLLAALPADLRLAGRKKGKPQKREELGWERPSLLTPTISISPRRTNPPTCIDRSHSQT